MSIAATDLVLYRSVNMPTADTGTSGGAMETTAKGRVTFQDTTNSPGGTGVGIECKSTSASDTGNITVTSRNTAGSIVTETKALTGTTFIDLTTFTNTERILRVVMAANAVGTVTVRVKNGSGTGAVVTQVEAGERGSYLLFYDSATPASSTLDRYEKIYAKNNHATLNLTNATIAMTADPQTVMEWAFSASAGDSVAARTTAPSGVTWVTSTAATATKRFI